MCAPRTRGGGPHLVSPVINKMMVVRTPVCIAIRIKEPITVVNQPGLAWPVSLSTAATAARKAQMPMVNKQARAMRVRTVSLNTIMERRP